MSTTPSALPSGRSWIACCRPQACPFCVLGSIAYDPRAHDRRGDEDPRAQARPFLVVTVAADAVKLVREMVRQHFEPLGITSPSAPGLSNKEFFEALGPLADYHAYGAAWANPKADMAQALEKPSKAANPNYRFAVECHDVGFPFEALLIAAGRLQARRHQWRRTDEGDRRHQYRRAHHDWRPDHIRRQGQNNNIPSAMLQNRNTPRRW